MVERMKCDDVFKLSKLNEQTCPNCGFEADMVDKKGTNVRSWFKGSYVSQTTYHICMCGKVQYTSERFVRHKINDR